jgi:ATP phosphoribosyltransferase regulatory subunit HisZ
MDSWLRQSSEQFRQTNALIDQLDAKGFTPLSTVPTHDAQVRRDHTLAIIERLAAWSPSSFHYPLKVFSTGPVFARGTWSESLDIEVLEDGTPDSESLIFDLLDHLVSQRFMPKAQARLVLVAGHLGLLRALLRQRQWADQAIQALEQALREGLYGKAEQILTDSSPDLLPLFRPTAPDTFHQIIADSGPDDRLEALNSSVRVMPTHIAAIPSIRFDLSLTGSFAYYSGLVFALYGRGQGEALIKGGRFSIHHQGRHWHGAGFTIMLPEWVRPDF